MLRTVYHKIGKRCQNAKHRTFVDVCVASLAGYFTLKKYFGWSLSVWLAQVFTPAAVPIVEYPLLAIAGYATAMKIGLLILDAYPATRIKITEPEGLNHCCLRINEEIARHLASILASPATAVTTFTTYHNFKVNVALVVQSLADHIKSTLSGSRSRDIFISVYAVPCFEDTSAPRDTLEYLTHVDPKRDFIHSRSISFSDGAFRQYECIKCVHSPHETCFVLDCQSNYYRSASKRHKTIQHYVGMKLQANGTLLGFVNIEFHNKRFFVSEDEIVDYVETHLIAFRYLLEYQFLKRAFFETVASKVLTCNATAA